MVSLALYLIFTDPRVETLKSTSLFYSNGFSKLSYDSILKIEQNPNARKWFRRRSNDFVFRRPRWFHLLNLLLLTQRSSRADNMNNKKSKRCEWIWIFHRVFLRAMWVSWSRHGGIQINQLMKIVRNFHLRRDVTIHNLFAVRAPSRSRLFVKNKDCAHDQFYN